MILFGIVNVYICVLYTREYMVCGVLLFLYRYICLSADAQLVTWQVACVGIIVIQNVFTWA